MDDTIENYKKHIHTFIADYTELTNRIYDSGNHIQLYDIRKLKSYFEVLFDIGTIKKLKETPANYKYMAMVLNYFPELEFFNIFDDDFLLQLFNKNSIDEQSDKDLKNNHEDEISNISEELKTIYQLEKKEKITQIYYSLNSQKYIKILSNYQQFVKNLGYYSVYDAYLDVYSINGNIIEQEIDDFLIKTKEEYKYLYNFFTNKYLPQEINRNSTYSQAELRYLYKCNKIKANSVCNSMKNIFKQLLNLFEINGFYSKSEIKKSEIYFYDELNPSSYPGICMPYFKNVKLNSIKIWLPELNDINSFCLGLHETGHIIQFLAMDNYEKTNPHTKRDMLDKFEWECCTFEFNAKIFQRLPILKGFWEWVSNINSNVDFKLNEKEETIKFARFIDLTYKIYNLIRFRIYKKILSFSSRYKNSNISLFKKEYSDDFKEYLRMDRPCDDIWPKNYFYVLDHARSDLAHEKFFNLYNFEKITMGNSKDIFHKFLIQGSSRLFKDLLTNLI